MKLHELKAQRHTHFTEAEKLFKAAKAAGKDLTGTELEQWNAHIAEMKTLDEKIRASEAIAAKRNPGGEGQPFSFPVVSMPGNGNGGPSEAWSDPRTGQPVAVLRPDQPMANPLDLTAGEPPLSFGAYCRGIVTGKWENDRIRAAGSESSLGGGGYLVPTPLSTQIIDRVRNASVMVRAGARTVAMDAQTLSMARVAGDVSPLWHTEAAAITPSDMAFEKVTFTAQTLAAIAVLSVELFEDASNIDQIVTDAIAKVLAIETDRACLRGSGTAPEPRGLRNQSNVVVDSTTFTTNGSVISASAPAGAVGWDWMSKQISGLWGVNENPNAVIYNARTAGELDLLRATTGEVLPPPGSVAGLQRLFTNAIPNNLTQGSNSDCSEAYIGDFSQAMIGMRRELVLELSRYAAVGATSMFSTMQVAIRAYLRADFQLARPGAFRVVTGIR